GCVSAPWISLVSADVLDMTALTVWVSLCATLLCAPFAIWLGYTLARRDFRGKAFIEQFVLLPMVVPPVAVGLLLLYAFGRTSSFGRLLDTFDIEILLTWKAAVIAAAVISFPLFAKTCQQTFLAIPTRFENVAYTLGKTRWQTFHFVTWPLAIRGVTQGALLTFARSLGEFGATAMVAGIIPGETETLALGIYSRFLNGDDSAAWGLAGISVLLAFLAVICAGLVSPSRGRHGEL